MDRIPLEVYRLIVSMIHDEEENPLWAPDKESSPSTTADGEVPQSISVTEVDSHPNSTPSLSSSVVESTINMQSQLQKRLATFRKIRLLTLIRKLCANMPRTCKREDLDETPRMVVKRLATLKSLRLCNKKLAVATAEFVFEEVLLHFTGKSHAKLEALSQHTYKDYVRVLQIVPKTISGPLLQKKEFGRWLHGERTLIGNDLIFYPGQGVMGPLVMPDCVKLSRKAIKFHYSHYSSLHAEQQKLFGTAEGILQAAIGHFSQLKRVESGACRGWSYRRQDIPPNEFESGRGWWRLERRNISPRDEIIDGEWKAGARQTNFDMDQGTMILRAVARGRVKSGARIDAGPLFRDLGKGVMQIADPEEKAVVNMLMADTKHFNYYFKLADLHAVEEYMSYGTILSFLRGMTKVESLRFKSASLNNGVDTADQFDKAFGDSIIWPHLTQLSVDYVDFLDFCSLASLIQRYKASLCRLTLYRIYYDGENRCNINADMRAGAMKKIRIWNMQRKVAETHSWADSGSSHIFSDGAWSPRLGSYLREELVAKLFPSFAHAQTGLLAEDDESVKEAGSEI